MSKPKTVDMQSKDYAEYFAIEAEGRRIGLASCIRCGATVILSDEDDGALRHVKWHKQLDAKAG